MEQSLVGTDVQGSVCVHQQPRKAWGEVDDEAVGQLAQCLLHLRWQLMVVVFLYKQKVSVKKKKQPFDHNIKKYIFFNVMSFLQVNWLKELENLIQKNPEMFSFQFT